MKKYIKPTIKILESKMEILAASEIVGVCNECCKLWHICQDRYEGKLCSDKRY